MGQTTHTLRIQVVDSLSLEPLYGASIAIQKHRHLHITDVQGRATIDSLPPGKYWLHATYIGYHHQDVMLNIPITGALQILMCPEAHHLHETLVEAKQQSSNFSRRDKVVLSATDIAKRQDQNIAAMLKGVTGVTMLSSAGNIAKPVIRGMHGMRLATIQGNARLEGQQWGEDHGLEVDPFSVSSAEVVKGAAAVEFGPEAIGGAIRLLPKPWLDSTGLGGSLGVQTHTNNQQGAANLQLEGRRDFSKFWLASRAHASFRKAGDSRTPNYVISNTAFEENGLGADLALGMQRLLIEISVSHYQTTQGIFIGSHMGNLNDLNRALQSPKPLIIQPFSYAIGRPYQFVNHRLLNARLSYQLKNKGKYVFNYSQQVNRRMEYDADFVYNSNLRNRAAMDLEIQTLHMEHQYEKPLKHHLFLKVGISSQVQRNTVEGLQFIIPEFNSFHQGVYVMLRQDLAHGNIAFGARYDHRWLDVPSYRRFSQSFAYQEQFKGATFSATWQHQLPKEVLLKVNISSGFRPPALNELYSYGLHYGLASFEVGNSELSPERAWLSEITFKKLKGNWSAEANLFAQYYRGFIYKSPLPQSILTIRGAFPAFEFRQDNGLFSGAEFAMAYQPKAGIQGSAQVSYLYAQNISRSEPFIFMPANRAMLSLGYAWAQLHFLKEPFLLLQSNLVAEQKRVPLQVDFAAPPAAYHLLNLTGGNTFYLGKSKQRIYLNFSINNLLNTSYRDYQSRYRYFTDEPGLNFILRITFKF